MPPVEMRWFRAWTDILDDPKLLLLAPDDRWYYVAVCALKRTGVLDEPDTPEMRDRKVALRLRLDHRERDEVRRRLVEVRLIDEAWQPLGWIKRQCASDIDSTATERQRRHREKQRHGTVTRDSNGDVTRPESEQSQSRAESEQNRNPREKTPSESLPAGLDSDAWSRWLEYRSEIRKPLKRASILAAQRKLAAFGSEQGAVVEQSIAEGYQGLFPLKNLPKKKGDWL